MLELPLTAIEAVVRAGRDSTLRISLAPLGDLARRGWYSADLHVHMNYGGAYRNTPRRLAFQARAEDLDLVENLIVNKEGRIPDIERSVGRDPVSTATTVVVHDQEYHTSVWGHIGLLGLRDHVLLPGYSGYAATAAASLAPTNAEVADLARAVRLSRVVQAAAAVVAVCLSAACRSGRRASPRS